jgi:predicted exporter
MLLKSRKPRGAVRQYLAWIGIATCGTLAMFANDAVSERSLQPLGLALVFGVLCGTALASIARRKSEIDGSER